MAEEHLSLKWNNHQAHFVDILTFLREKGMFVDVTLACGGKVYSAHKFVLSTCSDYFQKIFSKNTSANPVVFMKDVSCNDIEALLDFMYHGEVNVPQSSLGSLIKTAEGLQIKGLAVPDDPPSRKKQDRDKRERDPSSSSHYESRSPPPKRRSRNSPPRRNSARAIPPPVETYLDNNEADDVALRNSPPTNNSHDVRSSSDTASNNKKPHVANDSSEEHSSDGKGPCDKEHSGDSNNETPQATNCDGVAEHDDTAGPSGLRQSKQEEMEIKQEDVVELGEDDDDGVDWGGGMGDDGGGGGGGNNDGLNSGDNSVSFSDVLLPPPDQGGGGGGIMDGAGSGDSAMVKLTGPHSPSSDSHQTVRALHSTLLRPDQPPDMFTNAIVTGGLGVDASLPRIISISSGGRGSDGLVLQPSRGPDLSGESRDMPVANISMSQRSFPSTSLSTGRNGRRGSSNSGGFACPLCDRVMLFKSAFAKHMRTHTGEKPFACEFCSYRSAQVSNLNVHLRTVHKRFAPSHHVRQHLHLIRQQQYTSQLHESEQRQDAYASQSALLPLQLPQQPPPELHHFLSGQEHEQGPVDQHSSSEALDLQ